MTSSTVPLDGTLPTYTLSSARRCNAELPDILKLDVSRKPSPARHTTLLLPLCKVPGPGA